MGFKWKHRFKKTENQGFPRNSVVYIHSSNRWAPTIFQNWNQCKAAKHGFQMQGNVD